MSRFVKAVQILMATLREIFDEHSIFAGEIAVAEVNGYSLRIGCGG